MKKILKIILVLSLTMGIVGCVGGVANKNTGLKPENNFSGEGIIVFAKQVKKSDDFTTREVIEYIYSKNKITKVTNSFSIRYRPVGTQVEPEDQLLAQKILVDQYVKRYNQVKGIEIEAVAGKERYEATRKYDFSILDFDELDKACEEVGEEPYGSIEELTDMPTVAKDLRKRGYAEFRDSDFVGKGTKTIEYINNPVYKYKIDYEDNDIKKIFVIISGSYDDIGFTKEKAEKKPPILDEYLKDGVECKSDFGETEMNIEMIFDFTKVDFNDYKDYLSNIFTGTEDEFNAAFVMAEGFSRGYEER